MSAALEQTLRRGAQALALELEEAQIALLLDFMALLQKWNKVYNLTAVREPAEMVTHHLLDSLAAVVPLRRQLALLAQAAAGAPAASDRAAGADGQGAPRALRLLDVGSGGGLPGVVFAICCPQLDVSCVDTVAKKAAFIQQVAVTLRLPNLHGLHARVESLSEPFDVVSCRAFASLPDFTVWSRAALAPGGVWLAMKGKHPLDEIAALPADVQVFHVEPLTVPGLAAERCIVWLRPQA